MASSGAPSSAPPHSPPLVPKYYAPPSPPEPPGQLVPKHQAPPSPPEPPPSLLLPPRNHQAPAAASPTSTPDQPPPPKELHGPGVIGIAFLAFAFCIAAGVIIFALYQRRRRRQQDAQQLPTEQQERRPEVELPLAPSIGSRQASLGYQQHEIQPGFIPGMRPDAIGTLRRQISYVPTPILYPAGSSTIFAACAGNPTSLPTDSSFWSRAATPHASSAHAAPAPCPPVEPTAPPEEPPSILPLADS